MNLEQFIALYGHWAVLIGTLCEGETIVILAGYAAHQGLLEMPWVIAAAFTGSFISDQFIFHAGRLFGPKLLNRWPSLREPEERAMRLLRRYQNLFIVGFRFLYGMRTVSPFAIGMAGVSPVRFFFLNMIAAGLWAFAIASLGYIFGGAVETLIGHVSHIERYVLGALALAGFIAWIVIVRRQRARARAALEKADKVPVE